MGISLCQSIIAAEAEHIESLYELGTAELALVLICRILVARNSVGISCLGIREKITTEARVGRIVLANYLVDITKGFAISCLSTHQAKCCQKFLWAMPALEPVGRIHLAKRCMLI